MHIRDYRNELCKQADPYAYYLEHQKSEENGTKARPVRQGAWSFPVPVAGLQSDSYILPEISETYVILKTDSVKLYPDADDRLLFGAAGHPDVIYCDHDYQNAASIRHTPFLKPDYSPHTLLECNYIGPYVAIRRELLESLLTDLRSGGWDLSGLDAGEVIYALLLGLIERTNKISHVTQILFYLSEESKETGCFEHFVAQANREADRLLPFRMRALASLGIGEHERYSLCVIIPSKDQADVLIRCLESIRTKSRFYEKHDLAVVVVDNGSCKEQKEQVEAYLAKSLPFPVSYIYFEEEFNFSRMCQRGAEATDKELLLFLNDDVEFLQEDCLERMCAYAMAGSIGAVGAKLLFPDAESIQHIGVTNLSCGPTHKLSHSSDKKVYYFGANRCNRNVLAVTGACLMLTREKYFQVHGFHDKMGISYNDVDLCVKLYENGYYNVVLNECVFLHHESLSRGSDLLDENKQKRLAVERALLYECHPWLLTQADPFYHPELISDTLDFRINVAADHEIRERKSEVEVLACPRAMHSEKLKLTVEETAIEPDLMSGNAPDYVLKGWTLYLKHDECNYERYLLLQDPQTHRCIRATMMPVLRTDVQEVFRDQKHALLAGFLVRIPADILQKDTKYTVMLLYEHRIFPYRIITAGADYEPGTGYDTAGGAVL